MSIHYTNIRRPNSFQDFLEMNTKGETTTPKGFMDSTNRAPWAGNSPGVVGSYRAAKALYENYDDSFYEADFDYFGSEDA